MRFTEEQIFNAGAVHGYLMAKQGTWFGQLGNDDVTRRLVEDRVLKDFSRQHPKEAAEYQEFLSKWKTPKRKQSRP